MLPAIQHSKQNSWLKKDQCRMKLFLLGFWLEARRHAHAQSIHKTDQVHPEIPKPRPRPRLKKGKSEDEKSPPPPQTPPIPQPRHKKPSVTGEEGSPTSSPLIPRTHSQDRPQDRPPLPLPPMPLPSIPIPPVPTNASLIRPGAPAMAEEEDNGENNIYDEPEAQLRSVYDAEPWFYGKVSRQECEQMLRNHGRQQEFLVRESTRGSGSYALSVKYCYRIRHFPIETTTDRKLLIGKLTFTNLMDIVAYYQENPLFYSEHKEPITLGSPFIKR